MQYTKTKSKSHRLTGIDTTSDLLTSRVGLALFVRYLGSIGLNPWLSRLFGRLRKSAKGQPLVEIFKQVLAFFADGTSRHLTYFDTLREDAGYAATLECAPEQLLSSHSVKRFFKAFSLPLIFGFRRLLQNLFIWRLRLAKPSVVILGLDSVVLDNDDAKKRHGVTPTYRKKKGFQPLQLTWKRFIIDALFRRGSRNCNHGRDTERMIRRAVELIRARYSESIPIVVRIDSGFFDAKLFRAFDRLGIGYVCAGRLYEDIKARARSQQHWFRFHNGHQLWRYFEFLDQRRAWKSERRAIYSQPLQEEAQLLLEFARPDTVLYTNLGRGEAIDEQLAAAGQAQLLDAEEIVRLYHGRGRDELIHRAQKDFFSEKLPFKRFGPNMAYYFTGLVAFFVFEAFKEDVGRDVVPVEAYPTTVRRQLFDQAGKIVRHARGLVIKVTRAVARRLRLAELWRRANFAPVISHPVSA